MTVPPKNAALTKDMSVNDAFSAVLKANFDYMNYWIPVAHEGENIRGVHQARVAMRRMRSALVIFRPAVPKPSTVNWNLEMKWAAGEMGLARDMDVFISEGLTEVTGKIEPQAAEAKLTGTASEIKGGAYVAVRTMIDSDRFKKFKEDYSDWFTNQGWKKDKAPNKARKKQGQSIHKYAVRRLNRLLDGILAQEEMLAKMSDEELHELRKEFKKMRYATEFFSCLFDAEEMANFIAAFKAVQGVLGLINDVAVMPMLMDKLLEGVDDEEMKQYAEAMSAYRINQQSEAKTKLPGLFVDLRNAKRPWGS